MLPRCRTRLPPIVPHAARGRSRHASSVGLLGLPNTGKSTLFNAFARQSLAAAANFPFCTISPQTAPCVIPDPRLAALAAAAGSACVVPQLLNVVDIAGIVEGASAGAGLGNQFLGNLREVSAIIQVVRCFEDADVIHVMSSPDPIRDIAVVENELLLADLQSIEKRLGKTSKKAEAGEAAVLNRLLRQSQALLEEGLPARLLAARLPPAERPLLSRLALLTTKPMMYVCNTGEGDLGAGGAGEDAMTAAVRAHVTAQGAALAARAGIAPSAAAAAAAAAAAPAAPNLPTALGHANVAVVCAKLESELGLLGDEERSAYLHEYGMTASGLDGVLALLARLLQLQVFYTVGPQEARAWSIPVGATAVEAAASIHSDFANLFIKAEITAYDAFVAAGGEQGSRDAHVTRAEGKDYVMVEGDVALFRVKGG